MAEDEAWLVRHGSTAWSAQRRHTGRTDVPLDPDGEAAARALAPRLATVTFDRVLASPLQRARRTAELAGFGPEPAPLAVEWDYGDYEGLTTQQVQQQVPGWSIWTGGVPGGETLDQVAARADALAAQLRADLAAARDRAAAQDRPARVLLFAHAHLLRVLAARWTGNAPALAAHLLLRPAGVSVLTADRGVPAVQQWNA